jgi:hypothetical protein
MPAVGMDAANRLRDFGTSRWRLTIMLPEPIVVWKGGEACN